MPVRRQECECFLNLVYHEVSVLRVESPIFDRVDEGFELTSVNFKCHWLQAAEGRSMRIYCLSLVSVLRVERFEHLSESYC